MRFLFSFSKISGNGDVRLTWRRYDGETNTKRCRERCLPYSSIHTGFTHVVLVMQYFLFFLLCALHDISFTAEGEDLIGMFGTQKNTCEHTSKQHAAYMRSKQRWIIAAAS